MIVLIVTAKESAAVVVTVNRPAGGWPTLAELIERSKALGGDPFGPPSDADACGPKCLFCQSPLAACRCEASS